MADNFVELEIPEPSIAQLQEAVGASLIELLNRCADSIAVERSASEMRVSDEDYQGLVWIHDCASWLRTNMQKLQSMVSEYQEGLREIGAL